MTKFEQFLVDRGFTKSTFNPKRQSSKYHPAKSTHTLSTLSNLDYRYTHLNYEGLEIVFGLHEHKKPPTLIYPRPKIAVKRVKKLKNRDVVVVEDESFDDSMNVVLSKESMQDIFNALIIPTIQFTYDLT